MTRGSGTISRAVGHLEAGGVIAFPTETVYGLGADAHSDDAIERIYALKGRDAAKVMSLHVSDVMMARRYAGAWPDRAVDLTARFWPGPLTIVLPAHRAGLAARAIGADGTVGLRCPDEPTTRAVIEAFGRAIVGTSANMSGHPPANDAEAVRAIFGDAGLFVIESSAPRLGEPSTVLSLVDAERPRILRAGALSAEDLGL